MAALTDLSAIVNRLTGGNSGTPEHISFFVDSRVGASAAATPATGRMISLWQYNKHPGGSGAAPSTSAIPVNDTIGALFQTDPGGGRQKWLLGMAAGFSAGGVLILYDRLVHMGGLSGTTTTAQTTNLPTTALTRYTSGAGNQIWLEIYTAIGSTATTATVDYKNQSGTLKTSKAFSIGGSGLSEAQRIITVPLADGDTGVTTIENLDLVASTLTAGNIGMSIVHPLLIIPCSYQGNGGIRDTISGLPSIPEILTDACLAMAWLSSGTNAISGYGELHFIES